MMFSQMLDKLYEVKNDDYIEDTVYSQRKKIPLLLKKPYASYEHPSKIPEEDIIYLPFDGELNLVIISRSGTHKTVIFKRILNHAFYKGYLCNAFDPKHDDMLDCKRVGLGNRLLSDEMPVKIPLVGCLPSFAINRHSEYGRLGKKTEDKFDYKFAFNLGSVEDTQEIMQLFGLDKRAMGLNVLKETMKGSKNIQEVIQKVKGKSNVQVHQETKKSVLGRLQALTVDEMFNTLVYNEFPVKELWAKNKATTINFFSKDNLNMKYTVGKTLALQKNFVEQRGKKQKIINFFDDVSFYLRDRGDFSTEMVLNTINNWRSLGFNGVFGVQNPNDIHQDIISECKYKLIGDVGRPEDLRSFVTKEQYFEIQNLVAKGHPDYNFQYLLITPNRREFYKGYPLGPILGHPW